MKNFKVVEEETDAVYLSEKELAAIYALDLSNDKQLEEIRDIFIFHYNYKVKTFFSIPVWGMSHTGIFFFYFCCIY
jgi:hypothetical protein